MFFIQVVRGRPGGRLQFSGGGSKMAWLASAFSSIRARCPKKVRQRDLMMDESCGWLVMRQMSAFLIKSCPTYVQDSSYAPLVHGINPLYIRPVSLPAFRSTKHYREYEDPVQMDLGLVLYSHIKSKDEKVPAVKCTVFAVYRSPCLANCGNGPVYPTRRESVCVSVKSV